MDKDCVKIKIPNMFPEVQEVVYSQGFINAGKRYQYYYPIIMKYLKNKIEGWNIGDFLHDLDIQNLALYAITELTELVIADLKKCDKPVELSVICDRNYLKYPNGFYQHEVIAIDKLVDLYKAQKVDKIVICSAFHMNEIFEELVGCGVKLEDIISVNAAIFNERGRKC